MSTYRLTVRPMRTPEVAVFADFEATDKTSYMKACRNVYNHLNASYATFPRDLFMIDCGAAVHMPTDTWHGMFELKVTVP